MDVHFAFLQKNEDTPNVFRYRSPVGGLVPTVKTIHWKELRTR